MSAISNRTVVYRIRSYLGDIIKVVDMVDYDGDVAERHITMEVPDVTNPRTSDNDS